MATLGKGKTFSTNESVTNVKLHQLVDNATISGIATDDISDNAIVNAKIADDTIANAKLKVIDTAGKVEGGALIELDEIPAGAGVIPAVNIATGTPDGSKFLRDDQVWTEVSVAATDGMQIQSIYKSYATKTQDTVGIPNDDSLPQIDEGTEFLSQAITPKATTNTIRVDVVAYLSTATSNNAAVIALFNTDVSSTNAISVGGGSTDNGRVQTVVLRYEALASALNGTSATTFKVRFGGESNTVINGLGSANTRVFGGGLLSSITITEIKAS